MTRLQKTIGDLDAQLADPALYAKEPAKAAELAKQKALAERTLTKAEGEWLAMSEEYDAAMAD